MRQSRSMRGWLPVAMLLGLTSCSYYGWSVWTPPPGQLTLSNYRFDHAPVQAVMVAGPECTPADASAPPTSFDLVFKGSRVLVAAPNSDICWRRQLADGGWTPWNRAFTASGRFIDSQL